MVRGLAVLAGASVTAGQKQEQVLENPISTPQRAPGGPRRSAAAPAEQRPQGALGDRRVSELDKRGLHSRMAIAGAPITPTPATRMRPGLPGGADRPPQPAEQVPDFFITYRRLRSLYDRHSDQPDSETKHVLHRVDVNLKSFVKTRFQKFGGVFKSLDRYDGPFTRAELAYECLQDMARQADNDGNREQALAIRGALAEIDRRAADDLQKVSEKHGPAGLSSTGAPRRTPATTAPKFDWCAAYRQLLGMSNCLNRAGFFHESHQFKKSARLIESHVKSRFGSFGGKQEQLLPLHAGHPSRPEQMYGFLEEKARKTEAAGERREAARLRQSMETVNENARRELSSLTRKFGSLEDLAARAGLNEQQAPVTVGTTATAAIARVTVAPPLQPVDPVPAPGSVPVPPPSAPRYAETGGAELPDLTELFSQPPGPSSRVMPAQAPRTPTAPAPEVPLAQREAVVERFRSDEALLHAGFILGCGGADALGWGVARESAVLDDLHRLHTSAAEDPRAAAALADIDWSGIDALMGKMDFPPSSP